MDKLIKFLRANDYYNTILKHKAYQSVLAPHYENIDKLGALLHRNLSGKSSLYLNKAELFWMRFENIKQRNPKIDSLEDVNELFFSLLIETQTAGKMLQIERHTSNVGQLEKMWILLSNAPSFDKNTAALFVISLVKVHFYFGDLSFLQHFKADSNDRIFLPVDITIKHIFRNIDCTRCSFECINNQVQKITPYWRESLVWDDLWFWGPIAQRFVQGSRHTIVNPAKFWTDPNIPKHLWHEIEPLASKFVDLSNGYS